MATILLGDVLAAGHIEHGSCLALSTIILAEISVDPTVCSDLVLRFYENLFGQSSRHRFVQIPSIIGFISICSYRKFIGVQENHY